MKNGKKTLLVFLCLVSLAIIFELLISFIEYLFQYNNQIVGLISWLFLVPMIFLEIAKKINIRIEKNIFINAIKLYETLMLILVGSVIYYEFYYRNDSEINYGLLILVSSMFTVFVLISYIFSKKIYKSIVE